MFRKLLRPLILVPIVLILGAGTALAVQQTNGSGLTHEGASLGFNAKLDLRGEITYTSHDGTGFQVMCRDGLTAYQNQKPTAQGALRTRVTATCTDKDGSTIYVEIYFIDRGEPGTRDVERIYFTYDPAFALDANGDPNVYLMTCNSGAPVVLGCNDAGIITTGNVQIHQGTPPGQQATFLVGGQSAA
jgi:hypothetical protein